MGDNGGIGSVPLSFCLIVTIFPSFGPYAYLFVLFLFPVSVSSVFLLRLCQIFHFEELVFFCAATTCSVPAVGHALTALGPCTRVM